MELLLPQPCLSWCVWGQKCRDSLSERRELPLLEKQALVDEMLRGMPMQQFDCYRITRGGGTYYEMRKGWPQLRALLDFMDDKFPTWSNEDRLRWEQNQGGETGQENQ